MLENKTGQAQAADTPTQETKTFIRQVRTKTRRKYAPEDKIRIVLEGFRRELTVSDLAGERGSSRAYSMPGPRNSWKRGKSVSPGIRYETPPVRRSNTSSGRTTI